MTRLKKSLIWGGIVFAAIVATGILGGEILGSVIFGASAFTLTSCLILKNNFIGDMILDVFSWGFVRMPGLIFTLDLDGIIWLITVKLLFWVLGIILAVICGILAIALGLIVSLFVYPFALRKAIKYGDVN